MLGFIDWRWFVSYFVMPRCRDWLVFDIAFWVGVDLRVWIDHVFGDIHRLRIAESVELRSLVVLHVEVESGVLAS